MKRIRFTRVQDIEYIEDLNIYSLIIDNCNYVLLGGDFIAKGCITYLRPLDKVRENWFNADYSKSRKDVVFYMDNRNVKLYERIKKQYESR